MKSKNKEIEESEEKEEDYAIIDNEYKVKYKGDLGYGSFGHVYKCFSIKTNKEYACKSEPNDTLVPQCQHEYKILKSLEGGVGIPRVYTFKSIETYSIFVMDLLGPNLGDIMEDTIAKKFTLKCSLLILGQLIERLNFIHDRGIIHRDIKPENFLVSTDINEGIIYLIDFGLAKRYLDSKTGIHISYKKERPIAGTIKYISPNVHMGIEQSRRDDLISLLYSFIYLFQGELPWDEIKTKTKEEKIAKISYYKSQYTPDKLCDGLPNDLLDIFNHVFELDFDERPNYSFMQMLIKKMLKKLNLKDDNVYDWMLIELLIKPISMIPELKQKRKQKLLEEKQREEEEKRLKHQEEEKKKLEEEERLKKEEEKELGALGVENIKKSRKSLTTRKSSKDLLNSMTPQKYMSPKKPNSKRIHPEKKFSLTLKDPFKK